MLDHLIAGVLDVLNPERCAVCGREYDHRFWYDGARVRAHGLRPWDAPHLCRPCFESTAGPVVTAGLETIPLLAATHESEALVTLVSRWKYDGVRGLGHPLAGWLTPALRHAAVLTARPLVVPLPLHPGRRRERGFDQVLMLASAAAKQVGLPLVADILKRRRPTDQQASCQTDGSARRRNVAGAFQAREPRRNEARGLVLVDDLATTGATLMAGVGALDQRGWRVEAMVVVGMAARLAAGGLDTSAVRSESVERASPTTPATSGLPFWRKHEQGEPGSAGSRRPQGPDAG